MWCYGNHPWINGQRTPIVKNIPSLHTHPKKRGRTPKIRKNTWAQSLAEKTPSRKTGDVFLTHGTRLSKRPQGCAVPQTLWPARQERMGLCCWGRDAEQHQHPKCTYLSLSCGTCRASTPAGPSESQWLTGCLLVVAHTCINGRNEGQILGRKSGTSRWCDDWEKKSRRPWKRYLERLLDTHPSRLSAFDQSRKACSNYTEVALLWGCWTRNPWDLIQPHLLCDPVTYFTPSLSQTVSFGNFLVKHSFLSIFYTEYFYGLIFYVYNTYTHRVLATNKTNKFLCEET